MGSRTWPRNKAENDWRDRWPQVAMRR